MSDDPFAPIEPVKPDDDNWQPLPVPAGAPEPPRTFPGLGAPSMRFTYRKASREIDGYILRFEPKTFRQQRYGRFRGQLGWHWKGWGGDRARPLYRLPELLAAPPDAPVLLCEGEKAADAAAKLLGPAWVVIASMNGTQSPQYTDWSPLDGRELVIWPDNDEPGRAYAQTVAALALAAGAISVRIVEVPNTLPTGWDLADSGPDGILKLLDTAPEYEPEHAPVEHQAWPAPLAPEAYHGIAGEIVRRIEPETESDPAALLFSFLAVTGNALGAERYARVESDKHPGRLFVIQVGRTAKGRKGTSWTRILSVMEKADPDWEGKRVASGLSSGEGVIYEVRDQIERQETDKQTNQKATVVADEGVKDKRLMLYEGEFAKVLRSMDRQGNVLSAVMRDAWDHGNLRTLIKNNPNRATAAHVSLVGHITDDELRRELGRTEMANGLANRLMFICVRRSKMLARSGGAIDWTGIGQRLGEIFRCAPRGEIHRTDAAWAVWEAVYPTLSADRPGLLGAILGRAEAQVLRLSLIYALLDEQRFIDAPHMLAALACWDYAEASARFIFGDALEDPVADEVLRALRESGPGGMTRTELMHHFGRNQTSEQIGRALGVLARGNFAACTREQTGGRPTERWKAAAGGGSATGQQSYLRLGREGLNSFTSFTSSSPLEGERAPSVRARAHELNEVNELSPPWTAADAWVARARASCSRDEKADIVRNWYQAAGGVVDDGGEIRLPWNLPSGFARNELEALARDVGVMPKRKTRF